jgi:hypothetical protein
VRRFAAKRGIITARGRAIMIGTAMLLLMAATNAPAPPQISDEALAAFAATPFDKRAKMFKHEVLGINHGMTVVVDYPCGDICPDYTTRIIRYDKPAGPECTAAGGVVVQRMVTVSIAVQKRDYCVPKAVAK